MSKVRKLLLRPGVHHAPQGELDATPARVKQWVRTFQAMRKAGIRIPCSWGHQPDAVPCDDRSERQYYLSRLNAGYLEDLRLGSNLDLDCVLDVPGCELDGDKLVAWTRMADGTPVKTAIKEVSAAIRDWTDGTGKVWPDAIIHVALTPLPVVGNQTGFRTLSTTTRTEPKCYYLSLSTLSTEADMADDVLEDLTATTEEGGDYFQQVLTGLQKRGISLPGDTNPENVFERLAVALHALDGGAPAEEAPLDLDSDLDSEMPDDEGMESTTEEPRPVLMSLTTTKDPVARGLIARQQREHRTRQLKRIDAMVKRGLPVHRANQLRASYEGYQLSLTADGEIHQQVADRQLSLLDDVLPKRKFTDDYLARHGKQEPRPSSGGDCLSAQEIKDLAASVSIRK